MFSMGWKIIIIHKEELQMNEEDGIKKGDKLGLSWAKLSYQLGLAVL